MSPVAAQGAGCACCLAGSVLIFTGWLPQAGVVLCLYGCVLLWAGSRPPSG